jgi:hypothetical protein
VGWVRAEGDESGTYRNSGPRWCSSLPKEMLVVEVKVVCC